MSLLFEIKKKSGDARAGVITTNHGSFETPAFCPVGTKGTVKGISQEDLVRKVGVEVVLSNTYHLFLQPGVEVIEGAGGLHRFMGWDKPLVTDSGGFQVFSLGAGYGSGGKKITVASDEYRGASAPAVFDETVLSEHNRLAQVDDEGVSFTSHIDGTLHRFTPERSIEIQHALGADIFFTFDDFVLPDAPKEEQLISMRRTHRWAERSLLTHRNNRLAIKRQSLFGIVQGGRYADLRKESARVIGSMAFDGFGIGGTFSKEDMGETLSVALGELPEEKPRHLLGIGEPEDILRGVSRGIDMFDCVQPTRLGRTGTIYTRAGKIHLLKSEYRSDFSPLDSCGSYVGESPYTKAYVAHLFRSGEMLGPMIASVHNLSFIISLMRDIRASLLTGEFDSFSRSFLETYHHRRETTIDI